MDEETIRIKFIVLTLIFSSPACAANVDVLQTTPAAILGPRPTPSIGQQSVIVPAGLSDIQTLDPQNGWAITSDASGWTSLYKTTDGGQTWVVQLQ